MQPRCIPLRDLRNLRENIHMRGLNQYTNKEIPMSLADHADNRRRTTKTTIISPPSQNCLSLRNNAALLHSLCVICVICERIFTQEYSNNLQRRNPNILHASLKMHNNYVFYNLFSLYAILIY